MSEQIEELKQIFEYEIKRKLTERARSSANEFRILMNGFKFYDFTYSGKVNQTEFVKGILRTGLSGFNESDIRSIFNGYDINKTGYLDYKNFCNYLYGREPLIPLNNSTNETQNTTNINDTTNTSEQIIPKQKTPINTVQNRKTPLNNPNMNIQNNSEVNQIPQESQKSEQVQENGQNKAQIPPEQNQQNIDPNQTKEYFKNLIISLKDQIHTNNGLTYYTLLFELKNNSDQSQNASLENLVNAFKNIGLNIPQNDIINFFSLLDFSGTGKISIEDIINNIVDPLSEHRKLYVVNKFALIDVDKQGEVKVSLLKEKYNPKGHPDVIAGKTTDEEIFKQFCYTLDIYCSIRNISENINYKQFIDYYAGISSSILDEKYFEDILNGVWGNQNIENVTNNIAPNMQKEQIQANDNSNQNLEMNNNAINANVNSDINNERYNNEQSNRIIKKNKYLDSGFSENMGINGIFLGESTHVMPKSFAKKSFKKFKNNFGQIQNNNFNNNINPSFQNNARINSIKSNDFTQNNYNRISYNKTPINQSQEIPMNQNQIQSNNSYNINNNNERQKRYKITYNPLTNEYIPRNVNNINDNANQNNINKIKTPLNIQNNIINNSEISSANNTTNISNEQNVEIQNNEEQTKQMIINTLNKLKKTFILRGPHSLFSFQRKLSLYDLNHKGLISFDDFSMIIQTYTMNISPDEIKIIFDLFDKEKTGTINYNELIQTIIGQINSQRQLAIQKVYDRFNKDNNGKVSINEIKLLFNSRRHPDVISGKKTEGEIFGEFLDNVENYREYLEHLKGVYESNFSLEDFINFYSLVGMGIDDDNIFEFMMNNCWNLDNSNIVGKSNKSYLGGNIYRNNGGYDYRNNNINNGNLMARAGSQIIGNNRF